jgi:putative heme-binding domain-containing protein
MSPLEKRRAIPTCRPWSLAIALLTLVAGTGPVEAQRPPGPEAHRREALTRGGDATRGSRLFADTQRLACANCHSIDGTASKAGPDLQAIGDKFGRRDLVEAVLNPSATIAPGYGAMVIETRAGLQYQGVLKQSDARQIQIMGGDGKLVTIPKSDIESQSGSTASLMPEALQTGLTPQEFADLIDYLTTLKQPESALAGNRGMPRTIPVLARPVQVEPFFTQELQVPPAKVKTGLTGMYQVPGRTNVFLVLHQKGMIWKMEKTATGDTKSVFADLTSEVFSERGPNGLLGMTFHPKFRQNRKYYLKQQVFEEGTVTTVIVEKQFSPDFAGDSGIPGRRLIQIKSVAEDHSGGCVEFGPDGFLYFAMGDTGPHNDPNGHAQNMGLLLGKMMRIDVDHADPGKAYSVPRDNPFVGQAGIPPEIWASGFRNPWRFCFDPANGDLWLADVGQDRVEEVTLVRRGENHGWSVYEGFEPFSNQYRKEGRTFTPPVFAYGRKYGNSITGGYVYRGDPRSSFNGVYLCGDYTSKRIFGVRQEKGVLKDVRQVATAPQGLVSFGTDEAGNIYIVGFEGMVYRMDFTGARFDGQTVE